MKKTRTIHWLAAVALIATAATPGCSKKKEEKGAKKAEPAAAVQKGEEQKAVDAAAPKTEPRQAAQKDGAKQTDEAAQGTDQAKPDEKVPAGAAQAQVIIISWKGAMDGVKRTKAQAKTLADKVLAETAKTPFGKLVAKYSDGPNKDQGGKVPPMTKKDASAVFQPVFSLKVGQVSKVVEGPNGYYIFKRIK